MKATQQRLGEQTPGTTRLLARVCLGMRIPERCCVRTHITNLFRRDAFKVGQDLFPEASLGMFTTGQLGQWRTLILGLFSKPNVHTQALLQSSFHPCFSSRWIHPGMRGQSELFSKADILYHKSQKKQGYLMEK